MLQTEFVRSLNSNYERILLDTNPEEKRYQYCMIGRGGIKGLLPCTLRYINGLAYLYYDITSKQNVAQLYGKRVMSRQWVKDFCWSMEQIREELSRFLLDEQNILWYPGQVYQDLESNVFSFLFVPYYAGDNGFGKMLEFMIEHIDYEDDKLVECVYKMYEQFEIGGQDYLQNQIFRDAEMLEQEVAVMPVLNDASRAEEIQQTDWVDEREAEILRETNYEQSVGEELKEKTIVVEQKGMDKQNKKGIRDIFKAKKKKEKESIGEYQEAMQRSMNGYAVAENDVYEDWGKTIYIEETESTEKVYCLYTPQGSIVAKLDVDALVIGKRKGEADVVLEDMSISRMHAKIIKEGNDIYLEDLNSTNGTFKNGLRLKPYERRKLEAEDEIMLGKKELIFRQLTH